GIGRDRVGRGDRELLDAGPDERLRCPYVRVAWAHVRLDERWSAEALGLHAGPDHDEALGLVVLPVRAALGEARVADDADDLVALHELPRERRLLRRVELLGVEDVLDRPAVDAAVVVDAVEVRLRDLADRREVDAGDQHVDPADLDRRPRRLLPVAEPADALPGRGAADLAARGRARGRGDCHGSDQRGGECGKGCSPEHRFSLPRWFADAIYLTYLPSLQDSVPIIGTPLRSEGERRRDHDVEQQRLLARD